MKISTFIRRWVSVTSFLGAGILTLFIIRALFWQAEVVSYGEKARSYFTPPTGVSGEEVKLCFDDIVWKRICRSDLTTYFIPVSNELVSARVHRYDMFQYKISVPPKAGRVEPKCRPWIVPSVERGEWKLSGYASSYCFPFYEKDPVYTYMPEIKFTVK